MGIAELNKLSIFQLQLKIWDQIQKVLDTIEINGSQVLKYLSAFLLK